MALPEQQPEIPPDQQVTEIPEAPEIPAHVEQATGVSPVPTQIQPLQDDTGVTIAQPVPPPPSGSSLTVPAQSQAALDQMAKGDAGNSQTWFGIFWLMKIKKAVRNGLSVLFGGGQ